MPQIESSGALIKGWRGLHLFHASMSNCSQRVRVVLEEKSLNWESHLIDLFKDEQLTPEYQQINPKGVVPTLVHDDRVVTESNDIIRYIEENFPGLKLFDHAAIKKDLVLDLLNKSVAVQDAIKLLTFTYFLKDRAKKTPLEMEEYAAKQGNKALVEWHRKFSSDEFTAADLQAASDEFSGCLLHLDRILQNNSWLSGGQFGLADVSWMVNVDRAAFLEKFNPGLFGFRQYDALAEWYKLIRQRPSYIKAISDYLVAP